MMNTSELKKTIQNKRLLTKKDFIEEVKETLEEEKRTYDEGGECDDCVLGWIEALEYVLRVYK